MCARSNDIDHLQMRMINIFEWHGKTKKKIAFQLLHLVDGMKIDYAEHTMPGDRQQREMKI